MVREFKQRTVQEKTSSASALCRRRVPARHMPRVYDALKMEGTALTLA
jgi:hypothetical protein